MFTELPKSAPGIVTNNRTRDSHWGKAEVIATILRVGEQWAATKVTPISIGQISRKNGGNFPPHLSHKLGVDVDLRPMRLDGKNLPTAIGNKMYDGDATKALVQLIRANVKVKLILFNDPVLIKAGLTRYEDGHSNHLHVRFDY